MPVESVEVVGDDVDADVVGAWKLNVSPWRGRRIRRLKAIVWQYNTGCRLRTVIWPMRCNRRWSYSLDKVVVSRPSSARNDVPNSSLDPGMTFDGMLRELEALESLKVGDVVWERGNEKVITTRWVCSAKTERVEGKERHIVRCRVVARDFAQGCSAAQLGISSPTSSAEALRAFLCLSATKRWNIVGLDVSAAFLFADLEEDGRVLVTLPDGVKGKGGRSCAAVFPSFGKEAA